jgi:hypothetical protein
MRGTSQRTFGKKLMGAIAVLALASLATSTSGQSQQSTKDQKERKDQAEEKFYHENTPPPVSIEEGSLRILVPGNRPLVQPSPTPQTRYVYTGDFRPSPPPPGASNEIAHIKILQANGDTIYSNSQARGSWIKLELQDSNGRPVGDIKIRGGANFVADSDARLTPSPQGGGNLKHSYHHPGGGAARFRVRSIKVTLGDPDSPQSPVRFHIDLGPVTPPFQLQEYRILIWVH